MPATSRGASSCSKSFKSHSESGRAEGCEAAGLQPQLSDDVERSSLSQRADANNITGTSSRPPLSPLAQTWRHATQRFGMWVWLLVWSLVSGRHRRLRHSLRHSVALQRVAPPLFTLLLRDSRCCIALDQHTPCSTSLTLSRTTAAPPRTARHSQSHPRADGR